MKHLVNTNMSILLSTRLIPKVYTNTHKGNSLFLTSKYNKLLLFNNTNQFPHLNKIILFNSYSHSSLFSQIQTNRTMNCRLNTDPTEIAWMMLFRLKALKIMFLKLLDNLSIFNLKSFNNNDFNSPNFNNIHKLLLHYRTKSSFLKAKLLRVLNCNRFDNCVVQLIVSCKIA